VGTKQQVSSGIANVTSPPPTAASANVQPGGTLTYLRAADASNMDPVSIANSAGSDGVGGAAVYDFLVYTDTKDGQVKPQVATALTSTDGLVWTLKLRAGVEFSDGTAYDANAVKFNWVRLQDPNNKAMRAAQANLIQTMDVLDATTLRITLKAKNAVFPQVVAQIPFIASPAAVQSLGANFGNAPIGAGPFIMKSWTRDSQMTLVRNPHYWNAPRPYVDQLILRPIADETQRINTYQTGAGNMLYTVVPSSAQQMEKLAVEYPTTLNGGNLLLFNVRKAPFNDIRARQAVAMAIDRADYVKVVDNGVIEAMDSIFRHDSPFYDAGIVQVKTDTAKAQQLFDQLAAETGGPLTFTIYTINSATFPLGAQYLQGVLNAFRNVKVAVQPEGIPQSQARTLGGNFDAELFGNFFVDPEPGWSSVFTCNSTGNYTGFCDTKFDDPINDQRVTLDGNQRVTDIKNAQQEFYAQIPSLYVERRINFNYAASIVQDVATANDGTPLVDRIWIKSH
jgi:peptide/nickel transport system substrate-binding protein